MSTDSCLVTNIYFSAWIVFSKVHLISAYSGAKQVFLHFSLVLNSVTLSCYKIREIL